MGRGGHRWGAGRPGWHVKAEHCLRLDVRALARRKLLSAGSFSWHWSDGYSGERIGSIGIFADGHRLSLSYSFNGSLRGESVRIERTACTFGGTRPWLACPRCQRRVAVLMMRGGRFVCRPCGGVVYASQSEDGIARTWRRQRKLEARLGDDWERPKGMHRATHAQLIESLIGCESAREESLAAMMASFGMVA